MISVVNVRSGARCTGHMHGMCGRAVADSHFRIAPNKMNRKCALFIFQPQAKDVFQG